MAGQKILIGGTPCFIDYHDGEGFAIVNGRLWHWEHHRYCGPQFLKKNGEPRKLIPSEKHPVWDAFEKWLKKYNKGRKKARSWEIVEIDV